MRIYEIEKELSVYVTTNNNVDTSSIQQRDRSDIRDEELEYSLSDESYRSYYSSDDEFDEHNFQIVSLSDESCYSYYIVGLIIFEYLEASVFICILMKKFRIMCFEQVLEANVFDYFVMDYDFVWVIFV